MWNWIKLNDTKNYKYLGIDSKIDDLSSESAYCYEKLYDTFIQLIGLGAEMSKLLELKRKYVIAKSDFIITENKQHKMKAKFLEMDIFVMQNRIKEKAKGNISESTITLEKNMGVKLDLRKVTVKEYYDYLNYFTKNGSNI
jgi:DNA polymerase/3'-5' exonuclease PolX